MLPLTRKFTLNELNDKNHEIELIIRACQYFSNYFAEQTEKPRWKSYNEIEAERDNLLFAIDYLDELSRNNDLQSKTTSLVLQLGEILAPYLLARGHWNDYKRICFQCIETSNRINKVDLFVRFSHYLSRYFWHIQDFDNANHWAQSGYDAAKKINDKNHLAVAQHMLGILAIGSGKLALAKELLQEALNNRLEQLGCMGTCAIKEDLGFAFMEDGDLDSAESLLLESYNQQLASDDQEGQAIDLYYLGLIAEHAGKNLESIRMLSESMVLAISVNRATTTANCQHGLARLFEKIDDYENARAMAQSARTLYERLGMQAQAQATAQIIARI